jgi:hypothetical protein
MARTRLLTAMTAACLSITACGDDKMTTTTGVVTGVTSNPTMVTTASDDTTGQSTTDDAGSGTSDQSTGAASTTDGPSSTTEPDTTSTTEPDTTTTGVDDSTSTGSIDPIEQCLEMVEPGDECGECACMSCYDELQACQADEGCVAIRECAQEAGCDGLNCFGPCGDVFNLYGGPFGESGMLAQALGNCVGNECPGLCTI